MSYVSVRPHRHVQSTPSTTWTITHNSGYKPLADVLVYEKGVLTPIMPLSTDHTSDNVMTITFSSNRTGEARLF